MTEETNTDCQRFEARIAELIGGDTSTSGFVELCVHVRGCDECGEVLEIHTRLQDLSAPERGGLEEPTAEEWSRVRQAVLAVPIHRHVAEGLQAREEPVPKRP